MRKSFTQQQSKHSDHFNLFDSELVLSSTFCSINTDEEYCFQGSEADDVIKHIADIWNTSEITQDEAISQWISMHQ